MASLSRLRLFYLLHLSKPASDRLVFREIRRLKAHKIVEVGLGSAERTLRMLELAGEFHAPPDIHYTGIDLFEDREPSNGPGLSLRDAHRMLKTTGARVRLVPGTPYEGLSREANAMGKVDLIVLSPGLEAAQLAPAWFYIPRLLDKHTAVLLESLAADRSVSMRSVDRAEIDLLAGGMRRRKAA